MVKDMMNMAGFQVPEKRASSPVSTPNYGLDSFSFLFFWKLNKKNSYNLRHGNGKCCKSQSILHLTQ